ncbi:MAG: glycosyltransferase family 2 protein [Acidobacteria bacterium]|nr:glycosyltransferase family 2 protein [Acidobacteriota bacterium]
MSIASRPSDVELVVLDLDGGERLERCLASIAAQQAAVARVVVWDNGSESPVADRLQGRSFPFELSIARSAENLGFTGGVNAAIALCSAPFVGLVNNDVELDPRWIATLRPMFDGAPRLAAVQGIIATPEGLIDGAGVDVSDGTIRQALHGSEAERAASALEPWGVSATAALYRADALHDVAAEGDLLRAELFAWYEDVELSARLRARGWSVALNRAILATHAGSATAHRLGGHRLYLQTRNRYIVARAWPGTGRLGALLVEDLKKLARAMAALDLAASVAIIRAVVAGLLRSSTS